PAPRRQGPRAGLRLGPAAAAGRPRRRPQGPPRPGRPGGRRVTPGPGPMAGAEALLVSLCGPPPPLPLARPRGRSSAHPPTSASDLDHHGPRRLLPEDLLPAEEVDRLARGPYPGSSAVVWALLEETDAEALRAEIAAGRRHDACGLLLNRAVELLTVAVGLPG